MVHKDQNIKLTVKHLKAETAHYWSIVFERPKDFHFEAGDWIDITADGQQLDGGKTYSISSSPTEPDIMITFREGLSPLKKAFLAVQPGDTFIITQYGNDYDFQLHRNRSSVLIAGGVGVAPFRSMLKEMADNQAKTEIHLIYLNQNEHFLFEDELHEWSKGLTNLTATYIPTKELNRKKREKLIHSLIKNLNQNFYISGPPSMVESNEHLLIDLGVQIRDIRIDSFGGY